MIAEPHQHQPKLEDFVSESSQLWVCPMSHELMVDPVVAADGKTYERKEIERWLEHHDTTPLTNQRLDPPILLEDRLAKQIITLLVESGGGWMTSCAWHGWSGRTSNRPTNRPRSCSTKGKVEEAAMLEHAVAQGLLASTDLAPQVGGRGQATNPVPAQNDDASGRRRLSPSA